MTIDPCTPVSDPSLSLIEIELSPLPSMDPGSDILRPSEGSKKLKVRPLAEVVGPLWNLVKRARNLGTLDAVAFIAFEQLI